MRQRSIDNIETNDMNFKHLETTKDIVISPKNEYGDPQRPDISHKWTAKVSDGTNYVGDYAVKISGASMVVDSEDFTKLPVGQYQLEIWEQWTDADGTSELSIYPSPQQTIPFTIYANITDQAGKEIKEIGFQDVVDQAVMNIGMNYVFKVNTIEPDQTATVVQAAADGKNYVTFNIPRGAKGDKGDTGSVDNAGLTTAPAFVNLQTQVNNSAVGTNLLTNTSDFSSNWGGTPVSTTTEYNGHPSMVLNSSNQQKAPQFLALGKLENSFQYTCSFWAKADNAGDKAHTELRGGIGATDFVLTTNWVRYTVVLTSLSDVNTNFFHSMYSIRVPAENKGNVYIALPKLEKGSVATDWCPNPAEVLTQADYAKIQAAIVALGGSLK